MGCSTSRSRWVRVAGFLIHAVVSIAVLLSGVRITAAQTDRQSAWALDSWVSVGTGYESESTVDPDLNRALVPGGPFLNLTPGARFGRFFGKRNSLVFSATGSVERFFNDEARLLLGLSGWADFTLRPSRRFYTRLSLGADYFDDSVVVAAGRTGLNGRAVFGLGGARGGAEIILGARGRVYPEITAQNPSGSLETYTEVSGSVGAGAYGYLSRRLYLRGELLRRTNDAADPLFDYGSWYFSGGAQITHSPNWMTWLSAIYQQRDFSERPVTVDQDEYAQFGVRVVRWLRGRKNLNFSYTFARYVQPAGSADDTHRVSVFFTYNFGGARARRALSPAMFRPDADYDPRVADGTVRFRLHAPEATAVAVVGDFNGWSPDTHRLRRTENGWWELTVTLPPGSYQYIYVVDEQWTTPSQAAATIDDGFGNRNGLFVVSEP